MKFSLLVLLLLSTTTWAKWSVTTYNIRNFDNDMREGRTDLVELARIIKSSQGDVMAFEEVVNIKAFETMMKSNLPGYAYKITACGGGGKQQLAIAYNQQIFEYVNSTEDRTFSGSSDGKCGSLRPVLLVDLLHKTTKKVYTFAAVHLKAGGDDRSMSQRWKQYLLMEGLAEDFAQKNLILLGDFNTTGYSIKDRDYTKFEDFLGTSGLRTVSENLGCTSYWHGGLGANEYQPSILDHIVVQDKNMDAIAEVKLGAHCAQSKCRPATPSDLGVSYESVSDHCPIQVTFK